MSLQLKEDKIIMVRLLGGFEMRMGGAVITDSQGRARQLWNLLEYLIAFRQRDISQQELIDMLWEDGNSDNPVNALKNLVYRVRTLLIEGGIPEEEKIILRHGGSYCLNPSLPFSIDTEEFEFLCKRAMQPGASVSERIELYRKALRVYTGDFLPKSSSEKWVVPIATYFHNLYIKAVNEVSTLLAAEQRDEEILDICEQATIIDRFDESVHEQLIRALIRLGRQNRAMAHYEYMTGIFYSELGVRPSDNLRSLYQEIVSAVNHVETDLHVIEEDLRETGTRTGAFFCEYEVFKNIYRLQLRLAARTGQPNFLTLITLEAHVEEGQEVIHQLNSAMISILSILRTNLRKGDVISRFSASQYLVLMPLARQSMGDAVMERVQQRYQKENVSAKVPMTFSLMAAAPIE